MTGAKKVWKRGSQSLETLLRGSAYKEVLSELEEQGIEVEKMEEEDLESLVADKVKLKQSDLKGIGKGGALLYIKTPSSDYELLLPNIETDMYTKTPSSDCELLLSNTEDILEDFTDCFETILDEKKSKMQVVGSLFCLGKSIAKLGWNGTRCAVKHTPKAVVTVAKYKRELVDAVSEEIAKVQREAKEEALLAKIEALKAKQP